MKSFNEKLNDLALKLYDIQAFKFGDYKMKVGINSPIYFDLRVIVSHPTVMETISDLLMNFGVSQLSCDHLCGVPYTALPIATILSVKSQLPMLIRRKEAKDYGTKKLIEGQFKPGEKCVIIEDVITSGSSVLETAEDLRSAGLEVTEAVVVLDREQGGSANLSLKNINTKSLFSMMQLMTILVKAGKIEQSVADSVQEYLNNSQTKPLSPPNLSARMETPFEERSELTQNTVAKKLFKLMLDKRTNLCLAADLTSTSEILDLFEKVAPQICILKLHVDIIEDFSSEFIEKLVALAEKYKVLLMEDRKFGDIGNTTALQFSRGMYKVADWADLVTVHALPGPGVVQGIRSAGGKKDLGIFLVAEMSSAGNLITPQYTAATIKLAKDESQSVAGVVCQSRGILLDPGLIQLTPGVQMDSSGDSLGQQYNSPEEVVLNKGADIAVVGRGILTAEDPVAQAKIYREKLWKCYEKRVNLI